MAIQGGYIAAQNSKLTLNSGKSTQMSAKGLQGLTMPVGFTTQSAEASVIGTRIATKYATGASYEDISTQAYFAPGDPSQAYMSNAARSGAQIQDMWFWLDATDFAALDLITDPGGYVMVGTFGSPKATKNDLYTFDVSIMIGGSHIMFDHHITGANIDTVAGGAGVSAQITDANSGFLTAGFAVGDTIILTNVNGLDPLYGKIKTVVAGTIELEDGIGDEASVPTFAGISTTAIHGGVPVEVQSEF